MAPFRISGRRPGRRIYRFRPQKQQGFVRANSLLWLALLIIATGLLTLSVGLAVHSVLNARQNQTYANWRQAAESDAGNGGHSSIRFENMTMPDGSAITREYKTAIGIAVPDAVTSSVFHNMSGSRLPGMEALRAKNTDMVAWLTIDRVLDLPVVYRDNTWYLTHDFEGNRNISGALFLDAAHPLNEKAQNLLIHGHNMKDGSMFAPLIHYQKNSYWKKHPFIQLTTLYEKEDYVVFAVLKVPDNPKNPDYINYFSHHTFSNDAEFEEYIRELKKRSLFSTHLSAEPEDALLELSTCIGDSHLIVVARRLRKQESQAALMETINYFVDD